MDKERFEAGLAQRKSTLGAEYVENTLATADDFSRPFQAMAMNKIDPAIMMAVLRRMECWVQIVG